jgi:hypothetical protein
MREEEWRGFFGSISRQLPVSLVAKDPLEGRPTGYRVRRSLPIFDAVDLFEKHDCLRLSNGRIVKKNFLLKRHLRILFFVFLTEIEARLYRTQEWAGMPIKGLNETNLNNLIQNLLGNNDLFPYQKEYKTRAKFKEDLKAISSFRNNIVHVNKKLEMDVDFGTVIKRKRQMQRLLAALQQILDGQEKAMADGSGSK